MSMSLLVVSNNIGKKVQYEIYDDSGKYCLELYIVIGKAGRLHVEEVTGLKSIEDAEACAKVLAEKVYGAR